MAYENIIVETKGRVVIAFLPRPRIKLSDVRIEDPAGALDTDLTSFPVDSVFHGELSEGRRQPSSAPMPALPLSTAPYAADSCFNDRQRLAR